MSKRVALNKRNREKMKKKLLAHRAELVADLDGTDAEIDQLQDPLANQALADTWRMIPQIISFIHDQCAFARTLTVH